MKKFIYHAWIILMGLVAFQNSVYSFSFPGGHVPLCTPDDPDFEGYYYREHIPRCNRHVSDSTKVKIAQEYGIPKEDYKKYNYDHIISLCAGGSNDPSNLQPRIPSKKLQKDKVEWATCRAMDRGDLEQAEAIRRLKALAVDNAND